MRFKYSFRIYLKEKAGFVENYILLVGHIIYAIYIISLFNDKVFYYKTPTPLLVLIIAIGILYIRLDYLILKRFYKQRKEKKLKAEEEETVIGRK
ncbi:hypothetical protein EZV73_10125 [Acidaminobacter sp. JC074]|uniref:hypothetical protein n=1 Tax=Acidaminobacter sp. JC074 TaxID=2530199 RepID=UPI001F1052E8|nr:hypothetical protein [Acidaminobacter sp. JC074]MCH4887932.1 hypothetical protein [Acidaminobacter sp. JC074]